MTAQSTTNAHIFIEAYNAKTIDYRVDTPVTFDAEVNRITVTASKIGIRSSERPPYIEVTLEGESTRFYCRSTRIYVEGDVVTTYLVVTGEHQGSTLHLYAK